MAPVRLMATSKAAGSNGWIWASACSKRDVGEALGGGPAAGVRRASPRTGRRRAPSRPRRRRAASRVVWPVPQPTSSTRSPAPMAAASRNASVVGGERPVEVVGVGGPVGALVAVPGAAAARCSTGRRALRRSRSCGLLRATLPLGDHYSPKGRVMSSAPAMTTTSYAILGLLAVKPWTTHELVQQVDRSLRRIWPRAQSKLYEEPKKLVAHGYARADRRLGRPPPPHPLHDHRQGPAGAGRVAAAARRRPGPRVRAAGQDQLRRQRHQGRRPRQPRGHPRVGARAERGEPGHRPRLPRRARARSRSAPP